LLLGDLGAEQITDDARRFVAALDAGRHHLVIGGAHAEQRNAVLIGGDVTPVSHPVETRVWG
jgi:hypothetical protein